MQKSVSEKNEDILEAKFWLDTKLESFESWNRSPDFILYSEMQMNNLQNIFASGEFAAWNRSVLCVWPRYLARLDLE